jgi:hypothetical protein
LIDTTLIYTAPGWCFRSFFVNPRIIKWVLGLDYSSRGNEQEAFEILVTLLNLWKDADPNLPLLKQAKAEYAKLH